MEYMLKTVQKMRKQMMMMRGVQTNSNIWMKMTGMKRQPKVRVAVGGRLLVILKKVGLTSSTDQQGK